MAVRQLRGYKRHVVSEQLEARHPYLEDINSHLKDDDVSMASGSRQFPRLVEQLQEPSFAPEVLVDALCLVCDLCANQENKCHAISSGVVEAATNLLMHDSILVRRDAARVISCVGKLMAGRGLLLKGNRDMPRSVTGNVVPGPAVPRLTKLLLGCNDEVVKKNVAEAFLTITIFRDGCQQVVDQSSVKGIVQYCCATLPQPPPTKDLGLCLSHLLRSLAAITMYAQNGTRDVFGAGILGRVVGLLDRIPTDLDPNILSTEETTELVRQALRLLWHCGNDTKGRNEVLKADGVRVVTQFLSDHDPRVREATVCTLNVVALETKGKEEVLKHSLELLANLLHSKEETTYLHETSVQLVRCASELPAFRFAFARQVVKSIWLLEKIYGTAALAAVSPLLATQEDAGMRAQAAHVTAHFLKQEDPVKGDEIRVPPVCPPDSIKDPVSFAYAECTDILHNLVEIIDIDSAVALKCLDMLTQDAKVCQALRVLVSDGKIKIPEKGRADVMGMLSVAD